MFLPLTPSVSERHPGPSQRDADTGAVGAPHGAPERELPGPARRGYDETHPQAWHDGMHWHLHFNQYHPVSQKYIANIKGIVASL